MDRGSRLQLAAVVLLLVPYAGTAARRHVGPAPAPAPHSTFFGPAPAPAPSPDETCDCNPSVMAINGTCTPMRLPTKWSCLVDPHAPLQYNPRPQLTRSNDTWVNLNGIWQWEAAPGWENGDVPLDRPLDRQIVVPFPVRSELSGLQPEFTSGVSHMWYKTHFQLPKAWEKQLANGGRVLLHFGAIDWEAQIWVNGITSPMHQGGYDKFNVDMSGALKYGNNGNHTVIVRVYDPTDSAHIPLGKQRRSPSTRSIWYLGTEGIWQTVWLELVPNKFISRLDLIPNVDAQTLRITVQGNPPALGLPVSVAAMQDGKQVAVGQGVLGKPFSIKVPNPRLWSLDDPYLYTINVSLYASTTPAKSTNGATSLQAQASHMQCLAAGRLEPIDTVVGYFGMRKISIKPLPNNGPMFIHLNNKPIVQVGLLDQGFWPDGLYTAANEDALCYDIVMAKQLGFTTLRKHIKVEPDYWYYCADRIGMLVWQDMPSMFYEDPFNAGISYRLPQEKAQHMHELQRMIEEHYSNPSIVQMETFNEGWGQYDTQKVVQFAHSLNPSILWDPASGWVDPQDETAGYGSRYQHYTGYVGEIRDDHAYPGPFSSGATPTRASVCGEYGGLGLYVDGHTWYNRGDSIMMQNGGSGLDNSTDVQDQFVGLLHDVKKIVRANTGLSAAIYTQMSDVEGELNGILTYDRKVLKFDNPEGIKAEIKKVVTSLEKA
ncbi:probable beta-glucuronidase [Coccomyxa sp. Obi]|nr:probable beta-glucuronidase [Coccomyxa sp. Obi]